MCQTDHCPFWDVGVAAIAMTEDLHNNDICPCFDQSQTATCHDTVTQIDPNHPPRLHVRPELLVADARRRRSRSWPRSPSPLYACPAAAPTAHRRTAGNHGVEPELGRRRRGHELRRRAGRELRRTVHADHLGRRDELRRHRPDERHRPTPTGSAPARTRSAPASPRPPNGAERRSTRRAAPPSLADSGDHDCIPDNCELVTVQREPRERRQRRPDGREARRASLRPIPASQVATAIPQTVGRPRRRPERSPRRSSSTSAATATPRRAAKRFRSRSRRVSDQSPTSSATSDLGAEKDTHERTAHLRLRDRFLGMDGTDRGPSRASPAARPDRPRSRSTRATPTASATPSSRRSSPPPRRAR